MIALGLLIAISLSSPFLYLTVKYGRVSEPGIGLNNHDLTIGDVIYVDFNHKTKRKAA